MCIYIGREVTGYRTIVLVRFFAQLGSLKSDLDETWWKFMIGVSSDLYRFPGVWDLSLSSSFFLFLPHRSFPLRSFPSCLFLLLPSRSFFFLFLPSNPDVRAIRHDPMLRPSPAECAKRLNKLIISVLFEIFVL